MKVSIKSGRVLLMPFCSRWLRGCPWWSENASGCGSIEKERLQQEHKLSERKAAQLEDQLEARVVRKNLDENIKRFTDENPEIQRVLRAAASYFFDRGNPHELKRFVNALHFHYFLWAARKFRGGVDGGSTPALDHPDHAMAGSVAVAAAERRERAPAHLG